MAKSTTSYMRREQNFALLPQEVDTPAFTPALETSASLAIALLTHYSFDLSGHNASELVEGWQKQYPHSWLHLAVIEALYQGRYKAISVQQILTLWQRRGQATFHFNIEFETLICSKFPESLTSVPSPPLLPAKKYIPPQQGDKGRGGQGDMGTSGQGKNSPPLPPSPPPAIPPSPLPHLANKAGKLLPPAVNHSPIEQFMPETSDRSEFFTSKLKAIAQEEPIDENRWD